MFRCGYYKVRSGDLINFNSIKIPCKNMVAVAVLESDLVFDDAQIQMIPCNDKIRDYDFLIKANKKVK